jgi:hypothetical protein
MLLVGALVATAAFAIYVEVARGMGGIWIRRDCKNSLVIVPSNLLRLMVYPMCVWRDDARMFWSMSSMWPVNWPLYVAAVSLIVSLGL